MSPAARWEFLEAQRGAIALECLPAYAPELNPVECIRDYLKHRARRNLRAIQRRSTLLKAFWQPAGLF